MVNVNDPAWRAELRVLAEAATPGPWKQEMFRVADPEGSSIAITVVMDADRALADTALLAAAREAVPALLDAYEHALEVMESMAPAIAYAMAHTWTEADLAAYRALIREKVR